MNQKALRRAGQKFARYHNNQLGRVIFDAGNANDDPLLEDTDDDLDVDIARDIALEHGVDISEVDIDLVE